MVNGKLLYTNTNLDTWKKYTISTPEVKTHTLIKALMVNTRKPKREKSLQVTLPMNLSRYTLTTGR